MLSMRSQRLMVADSTLDPRDKPEDDNVDRAAMISAKIAGALILALPALAVAWIQLRRQGHALFLFAAALILVGIGYLTATGATDDIARSVLPGSILQPAN